MLHNAKKLSCFLFSSPLYPAAMSPVAWAINILQEAKTIKLDRAATKILQASFL